MATTFAHPFSRHLQHVKRRLLIVGATVMVAFIGMFSLSADLIEWFKQPLEDDLLFYGPAEALFASIKISFLAAVVVSLPVMLHQFWQFVRPALLPGERKWAIPLFLLATGFFVLGLVFCNVVILPLVIDFFVSFGLDRELKPELAVGTYVDFNVKFLLAFGCAFEIPLALSLLARAGFVSAAHLARYRRHAAIAALLISGVLTPDATLFTMLLMAGPLIVLYEIGVWGAKIFGRKRPAPSEEKDDDHVEPSSPLPTGSAGTHVS